MIGVGIIGAGRIARAHLNALNELSDTYRVVSIGDIAIERAEALAKEYGIEAVYKDYRDMLAGEELDLVSVTLPNGLHYSTGKAVLNKGFNLLMEKPFTLKVEDTKELVRIAENKHLFAGVVLQKRLTPLYREIKRAIENGKFGKVFLSHLELKWNRPDTYFDNSWRGTESMDGGLIFNQAIHDIDLIDYFVGPVKTIFAYGGIFTHRIETEDTVVGVYKTENRGIGSFELTISVNEKNMGDVIEIFGEKEKLIVGHGEFERLNHFPPFLQDSEEMFAFDKNPTLSGKGHKLVYEEVARVLKGHGDSPIDARNVLHSSLVAEAMKKAIIEDREIEIDAEGI